MDRHAALWAAGAAGFAAFVAAVVGVNWIFQVLALTLAAGAVAADALRRVSVDYAEEPLETVPRSRVMHYARIGRIEGSARLLRTASNAFEHQLLRRADWARMTPEELRELAVRTPVEEPPTD